MNQTDEPWWIFRGTKEQHDGIKRLPPAPPWRQGKAPLKTRKSRTIPPAEAETTFIASAASKRAVNAALYLRRPLLVTGKPGTGKSSLARAVAYELNLGKLLYWSITSKSTLNDGLYSYDAVGRLQEAAAAERGAK